MLACFLVLSVKHLTDDGGLKKPNNKTSKNEHQRTPKSLSLSSLKTIYMEFLVFADLSAEGHSDSKHPPSPESWPSPKPDEHWRRCSSKPVLDGGCALLASPQPCASQRGTAQAAVQALDCSQDRPCLAVPALWEGPPSHRSLLRPALSLPVLSWGWQFKQALSLCIQSRFMRADKDVT